MTRKMDEVIESEPINEPESIGKPGTRTSSEVC